MSKNSNSDMLQFLTQDETAQLEEKTKELRDAIEKSKFDAYDETARAKLLIAFGEVRALLEKILYAREFNQRLSEA